MKKAEIIIAIISLISLILNLLFLIPGTNMLLVLSFMSLSVFYGYLSFAFFNNIKFKEIFKKDSYKNTNTKRIIGAIGTGFALSITIIGILFKFQYYPGGAFMLMVGFFTLITITLIGFMEYLKNKSPYYIKILKRTLIVGAFGAIFMFAPYTIWLEIKYRNYPDYAEALKKALESPDSKELWENVDKEYQKINNTNNQ